MEDFIFWSEAVCYSRKFWPNAEGRQIMTGLELFMVTFVCIGIPYLHYMLHAFYYHAAMVCDGCSQSPVKTFYQ